MPRDPFPEITDVKKWVGEYLKDADARHNGRVVKIVQERLDEVSKEALVAYLS